MDKSFLDLIDEFEGDLRAAQCIQKADFLLCECNTLSLSELQAYVEENDCKGLSQLQDGTGLGSGCGKCLVEHKNALNEIMLSRKGKKVKR
jgi:bacterioferritin-associated ferredoxin